MLPSPPPLKSYIYSWERGERGVQTYSNEAVCQRPRITVAWLFIWLFGLGDKKSDREGKVIQGSFDHHSNFPSFEGLWFLDQLLIYCG